jgi:hypothetical protein
MGNMPLGPFLVKIASSISPFGWMLEILDGPKQDPSPLPYLQQKENIH